MRTVYWMLVVGVALFVSGIGFVIAGARASRLATPVEVPLTTPVASIQQVMNGITAPAATVVYDAVGYVVDADGVQEIAPQNDEEWAVIANSAAALVESGNLLLLGDRRPVDLVRRGCGAAREGRATREHRRKGPCPGGQERQDRRPRWATRVEAAR